jgi:hypothetical protein
VGVAVIKLLAMAVAKAAGSLAVAADTMGGLRWAYPSMNLYHHEALKPLA